MLLSLVAQGCEHPDRQPSPPAPAVTVSLPVRRTVSDWDEYPGRLAATNLVELRARVSGFLERTSFDEGAIIQQGDVLFVLDARPYQADLERAQAALAQAQAQQRFAQSEYERMEPLVKTGAVAETQFRSTRQSLEVANASIASAQAVIDQARLNVEWCQVRAPIRGRVGRKLVTVGNLITGGTATGTLLTTITSLDPIYCYADVDERSVLRYQQLVRERQRPSARNGELPAQLAIGTRPFEHEGHIDFVNNQIDPNTGTISIRGVFANPDGRLLPGFYGRLRILDRGPHEALLVPEGAIGSTLAQQYVMVVGGDDVVNAIREQNLAVAAGVVGGPPLGPGATGANTPQLQFSVNAQGRLTDPAEFAQIVIRTGAQGQLVRIRDVGRVELGAADYGTTTYLNGKPAIGLAVFQLPGTNAIATANAVRAAMEKMKQSFPAGLDYATPYDTTQFTREGLRDVLITLAEATGLVVLVVMVFLQGWRASIIPLLAVPVSLIGACAVRWMAGFSINTLSLFGMVLAIGIVVDDAIVVVENVERWIEQGLPPREAAHRAMHEVTGAVIAIAMGLSAVFIPVAFIGGITGQFYRQFALTIAFSTLLSALNSLTLSPALAALILRPREKHHQDWLTRGINVAFGWFFRLFNRGLGAATAGYVRVLRRVVRMAVVALVVYGGLLVLTYLGFKTVPTGFIPAQDTGYLLVNLQMPAAAALQRTDTSMKELARIANETPGVDATFAVAGYSFVSGTGQSDTGAMFVVLSPFAERTGKAEIAAAAIANRLRAQYAKIQEGQALVIPPPPVRGMGNAGGFVLELQDRTGTGTPQQLQQATQKLIAATRQQSQQVTGVFSTYRSDVPQLRLDIDRLKVKQQGLVTADVFQTLQVFLGSLYINDFNFLGRTYRVIAQAEAGFRAFPSDVPRLETRNASGGMVPLGSVLSVEPTAGPDRINRYNLSTAVDINGSAAPGISSGQALSTMEKLARENLPAGYGFEWTGLAYQETQAANTALLIFPLCVLFVWLTHSAEYESFALSTAIILIVPMCLLFAIGGVWLRGMENNIFTQIGFVVLAGLSAKNAVLIVEFAKQQEEQGKTAFEAAVEAARLRLRPILMTSFAFILGVLPLVWATGAGAEMRRALGTAVFFGMLGVTFFGIFLTPVFFVTIRYFFPRKHRPKSPPPLPEHV